MPKLVKVVHNAPGKRGKQEYREFKSVTDAVAYIERNQGARLGTVKEKNAWKKKP